MKIPSTKELRAFETVARLGSIKAAAESLHVTPSALSRRIQTLEEELGQPLFHRAPRGLTLTDAGRLYAGRLSTLFTSLAAATDAARLEGPQKLRILAPGLMAYTLMRNLKYFTQGHPGARMSLDIFPGALGSDSRIDEADIVFLFGEGPWDGWDAKLITANTYAVPMCAAEFLPQGMLTDVQELADHTWIQFPLFPEVWSRWCEAAGCPGLQPKNYFEVNSGTMAREAALSGMGIWMGGIRPGYPVEPALGEGRLVLAHSFHSHMGQFGFYLAYRPEALSNPLVPAFRDWILARIARSAVARVP